MSIRQIIVRRASTRRAPAIASWPRARLWLTLTREKEEQKPDSATGGCQQKHCSHGKDQHAGSSNEPLEYRGMLDARAVSTFCSPLFARDTMMSVHRCGDQSRYHRPQDESAPDVTSRVSVRMHFASR